MRFVFRRVIRAAMAVGATALLLGGCTQPQDTVIPADEAQWTSALTPSVQKLSPAERDLFAAYVTRHIVDAPLASSGSAAAIPIPVGTTIGQAIEEQRVFVAPQGKRDADAAAPHSCCAASSATAAR